MKNTMRRAVALMLMACLLLSVMAPVSLKAAAVTVGDVITYAFDGSGVIAAGSTYKGLPAEDAENAACVELGDFTWIPGKATSAKIVDDRETQSYNKGYLFHSTNWKTADGVHKWIALKFNVAEAGKYDLTPMVPDVSTNTAKVFIERFNAETTYDSAHVAALVDSAANGTLAATFEVTFEEAGDYVMILRTNRTNGNHFRFYGMTLTLKEKPLQPAEMSFDFKDAEATNWTAINCSNHGTTTGTFINSTATLVVQLNEEMGVGSYKLNLEVRKYASGDVREVYLIPNSAFEGASVTLARVDQLLSSDYYVGTVDCFTGGYGLSAIYEVETQDTYVLALKNVGVREQDNHRASIYTMSMVPVSKVVNDTYYTVAEALAAGETNITLTGDVTENIVLTGGATLDLNGNTITGNVAVNNGQIVDNAGNGGIVGTLDATGNQWLSLYDGTAYKFFSYTKNSGVRAEEATDYGYSAYYYDVELSQAAYELIATGESGIDVEVVVSWTGEESGSKTLALNQDNVKQWAQAEIDGEEWGLKVQLTGVPEGVTGVTVDVTFTANGASIAF